jgi:hypothetical protein
MGLLLLKGSTWYLDWILTTRDADLKGGTVKGCGSDIKAAATLSNNAWIERSGVERRSGKDKRRGASRAYFLSGGRDRRRTADRRQSAERRDGWLQVGKWRSIGVFNSGK